VTASPAIRPATPVDAEAIARLLDQLGYPTPPADVPARLARATGDGRGVVLVAERAGAVVGLATLHVLSVLNRRDDVAWLTALVVDAGARRSGVGRALVAAVEEHARRAGCERLSVTTHERRADAHSFYADLGLEFTGRRFGKVLTPQPK
jgi:GNAT superfamily N-acetyltransferase